MIVPANVKGSADSELPRGQVRCTSNSQARERQWRRLQSCSIHTLRCRRKPQPVDNRCRNPGNRRRSRGRDLKARTTHLLRRVRAPSRGDTGKANPCSVQTPPTRPKSEQIREARNTLQPCPLRTCPGQECRPEEFESPVD